MTRLIGAVLLAAGTGWMGFRAAAELGERERALSEMAQGLALLEQELELDAPPLKQLMDRLVPRSRGPARALFFGCGAALDSLEEERFSQAWRRLVGELALLGREGQACISPLGDTLGRCGCEEQLRAIRAVRRRLEAVIARAEEERRRTGKVYQTLGLSGGAFLVILLL